VHHLLLVVHVLTFHHQAAGFVVVVDAQLGLLLLLTVGDGERRPALLVLQVGLCAVLEQQSDALEVVLLRAHVQRGEACPSEHNDGHNGRDER
jgi:hypothetical protein